MKKEHVISSILSVSQQDLAILLGVSRSQVAMYQSGKRELPVDALTKLGNMIAHMNKSAESGGDGISTSHYQTEKKQLESLLLENRYQQSRITREIELATRKQQAQLNVVQLARFLRNEESQKKSPSAGLLDAKAGKASGMLEGKGPAALTALKIKQGLLIHEKEWLDRRLDELKG